MILSVDELHRRLEEREASLQVFVIEANKSIARMQGEISVYERLLAEAKALDNTGLKASGEPTD